MAAVPSGQRPWSLVGDEVRTGKIEEDCWYTAISMSSVPLGRDNYLHLDNVAGAGLGCVGERPLCQAEAVAELFPGVRDQCQPGRNVMWII